MRAPWVAPRRHARPANNTPDLLLTLCWLPKPARPCPGVCLPPTSLCASAAWVCGCRGNMIFKPTFHMTIKVQERQ